MAETTGSGSIAGGDYAAPSAAARERGRGCADETGKRRGSCSALWLRWGGEALAACQWHSCLAPRPTLPAGPAPPGGASTPHSSYDSLEQQQQQYDAAY